MKKKELRNLIKEEIDTQNKIREVVKVSRVFKKLNRELKEALKRDGLSI